MGDKLNLRAPVVPRGGLRDRVGSLQSCSRGFGRRGFSRRAAAGPYRTGQVSCPSTLTSSKTRTSTGLSVPPWKTSSWALPKVDIAERVIKAVNPAAEVVKRRASWTEVTAELRDVDVIFACVDSIGCRSELEAFARRFLIPLIDIGMDVHESSGEFSISGQVMLSMPGKPCMRCMGLVTDEALAQEAAKYGAAGGSRKSCGRTEPSRPSRLDSS